MAARSIILFVLVSVVSPLAIAGDLTPPGAPAPTMKTLQEVYDKAALAETRTPISSLPFTITQPGSYVLTTNLGPAAEDTDGITITVDNATIDLNGFALIGAGKSTGASGSGITAPSTVKGIVIRNGTIRDWCRHAVGAYYFENSQFEGLRCLDNGGVAIYVGENNLVRSNECRSNGQTGILTGHGSRITDNTCSENGDYGIGASGSCYVSGNTCLNNANRGIIASSNSIIVANTCQTNSDGIMAGNHCVISNNSCSGNTWNGISVIGNIGTCVQNNTASNNRVGIYLSGCDLVSGNVCQGNWEAGIRVGRNSRVVNNVCSHYSPTVTGTAIEVLNSGCCVEANLVTNYSIGIASNPATGNYFASNRAHGNVTNYDIAVGNTQGTGDLANVSF